MTDFAIRPLTAERWPALEDLFGRAGASNGCWCMYWRIGPGYHDRPGVAAAFARHGFQAIVRHKPERPVMRRNLGGPA